MCEPCEVLPPLALCVRGILRVFDQHVSQDEDHSTLSKKELRGLVKTEMGPEIQEASAQKLSKLFERLDLDGDRRLDFPEFMSALGVVTCMIHDRPCVMHPICNPPIMVCPSFCPPEPPIVCIMPEPVAPPCVPLTPTSPSK